MSKLLRLAMSRSPEVGAARDPVPEPPSLHTASVSQTSRVGHPPIPSLTQLPTPAGILDALPDPAILLDQELRVSAWNRKAEQITGIQRTIALGRPFRTLPHGLQDQTALLRKAITERRRQVNRRIPSTKGGRMHFTDLEAIPVEPDSLLILLHDSTADVRTTQLLAEADKMLSIAGMAAGMAHEINNPLSGVLQNLQNIHRRLTEDLPANREAAARAGIDLEALQEYLRLRAIPEALENSRSAADRATRVVTDMLGFSRNDPAHMEKVWIQKLIDSALRLLSADHELQQRYQLGRIRILRNDAPPMTTLQCHRIRLEQVLFNLLRNAVQALKDRKRPKIRIVSRLVDDHCEIEIADNGPGVPPDIQEQIFTPFFTTKPTGEGIGLGLAICRHIVEDLHQGSLELDSPPGKGARFILRLPLSHPTRVP